jgi:Fic family protein
LLRDDKLLCPPREKPQREARNGVEQLDYIAYLVNELKIQEPRESHIQELHRLAIEGIYPCGGTYRNARMRVKIQGSAHNIPHEALVPLLVHDLVEYLNVQRLAGQSAVERAAYALWRVNWIHPFAGGNGRTARALSYLILCIDNGATLPGIPTIPILIFRKRKEYVRALIAADKAEKKNITDVSKMTTLMHNALTAQLESALHKLARSQS